MMIFSSILLAAIELSGVVGNELDVRAYFDANNAFIGDPLVLDIDFVGEADFASLHPPALSKVVDSKDWKIDDSSAKTDTYDDARRLIYRVRPMREGVLWFPALEFSYRGLDGNEIVIRSNEIPVHAKKGAQVAVEEVGTDFEKLPDPDELIKTASVALVGDDEFAWKKALVHPSADAFARFNFTEAKMNEARCAILEGNWQRALKIYSRLEWKIGQSEAIERGIIAALARKYDNPNAELPMWRQVLRPVLKHPLKMRLIIIGAVLVVATLFFTLLSKLVRALAAIAFALILVVPLDAKADLFEEFDKMFERQREEMQQMMNSTMSMTINGEAVQQEEVKVRANVSTNDLQVGTPFEFILEIEAPKNVTLDQMRISLSEMYGLNVLGNTKNLADKESDGSSNVVHRLAIPVRYDVPFKGALKFTIGGMMTGKRESGERRNAFMFSFSNSFSAESDALMLDVKPLDTDGQPADFSGVISEGVTLTEMMDMRSVETNDVIQITYRLDYKGYIPKKLKPEGVAFEMGRKQSGQGGVISWRRYFIADGTTKTPKFSISYYDPKAKEYKRVEAGGSNVEYK